MPKTKNPLLRYKFLDQFFRNSGRTYTFQELLGSLNVKLLELDQLPISVRQLREDIKYMRSEAGYEAPIESDQGSPPVYRYTYPSYSIQKNALNAKEAALLGDALKMLERFEGSPNLPWIQELSPILRDSFGLSKSSHPVISFQSNRSYTGYDHITPLFNAINNKRVLKIAYKPFGKDSIEFSFHPYFLKQYNQRWFAIGRHEGNNNNTWNVALDRIVSLEESRDTYRHIEKDWSHYFDDIIGVTMPAAGDVEKIELLFDSSQAPYILTKPLHQSQEHSTQEDGSLLVILKLIVNFELESTILSFGEKVTVVAPKSLKEKVKDRVQLANKKYL
jgi:predicted DNA-binding transcriptional regulator YafY